MEEANEMSEEEKVQEEAMEKSPRVTQKLGSEEKAAKPRARRAETKKLEQETERSIEVVAPAPHLGLTRNETNWAALAHASILLTLLLGVTTGGIAAFLGPIVPALIWYAYRDKSEYVTEQARQATIFQVAGLLGLLALALVGAILVVVGWTVSAVLVIVLIGLLLLVVMLIVTLLWGAALIALPIAQVVYGCYAALEAYNGRPFRDWWIADAIDRYQAQA
jgi:uncharacterized Tic20 family protein